MCKEEYLNAAKRDTYFALTKDASLKFNDTARSEIHFLKGFKDCRASSTLIQDFARKFGVQRRLTNCSINRICDVINEVQLSPHDFFDLMSKREDGKKVFSGIEATSASKFALWLIPLNKATHHLVSPASDDDLRFLGLTTVGVRGEGGADGPSLW